MKEINSFSSVIALGHRMSQNIMDGNITVEEKVDGSQISFSVINGELFIRSKGQMLILDEPEGMFKMGVENIKTIKDLLVPNWIYRGEYLNKPKHNTLCYNRIPEKNIIIYDIDTLNQCYLDYEAKSKEAKRLGLEVVPLFYHGDAKGFEIGGLLDTESVLGGCKIEGVVIKNYEKFSQDKKTLMAKIVRDDFKEKHEKEWKKSNMPIGDIISLLGQELKTEARWEKAYQHLKEQGQITGTLKDIGLLIKEVPNDILKEETDYIKDRLFNHAKETIMRIVKAGLPEWYKEKRLNKEGK